MIAYMIDNCVATGYDYAIVTDNDEIEAAVKQLNGNVVRVDDEVSTGSERIALAAKRYFHGKGFEYIVNLQGDEPMMQADSIRTVVEAHKKSNNDIYTAVRERSDQEGYSDWNVVKAAYAEASGQCFYFSRASIPFYRNTNLEKWYQHIGIYCYRAQALQNFVTWEETPLEKAECLEQLRALENNLTIGAAKLDIDLIGVDTPEDIKKIEGVLS